MEFVARKAIAALEGGDCEACLDEYLDENSERYARMVEWICQELKLDSLKYQKLDDLLDAILTVARLSGNNNLQRECLCTYCWNGKS